MCSRMCIGVYGLVLVQNYCMYVLDQNSFFLSVKIELLVDFEPKLKWDPIVILNNILWVHILLSEENNVVYSFSRIE